MGTYFFDVKNDGEGEVDQVGLNLDGPEQARTEAVKALPDIARDVLPDGHDRTIAVSVRDETGRVFFRASLTLRCEWFPQHGS
jgi:hypothetical protein